MQRLRPSGAPAGAALPLARPSTVPARKIPDVLRGSGQPLTDPLREEMQARLGADFSDVRVHTDGAARASAAEIGARAYTSGSHVVIGNGGGDKHTLAHELTHVIQQRQGPVAGTGHGNGFTVSDPFGAYDKVAEVNASPAGRHTVAHEPAHMLQQPTRPVAGTDAGDGLTISDPNDAFERTAEARATQAMRGPAPATPTAGDTAAPAPAGTAGAHVQRLVGFEVEVSLPSYQAKTGLAARPNYPPGHTPPSADDMTQVSTLFFGGLPYDTSLIDGSLLKLNTDHNVLQRHGKDLYEAVEEAADDRGWSGILPLSYVPVSNLEYKTNPLDELAPESTADFFDRVDRIEQHVQNILNNAPKTSMSRLPDALSYRTGLPEAPLYHWLGGDIYNDPSVVAALGAFAAEVSRKMSVQATAGVLPTGMPTLYAQRAKALGEAASTGQFSASLAEAIAAVVDGVNRLGSDPKIVAALDSLDSLGPGDREAFSGALHVGLSYAIGNAINQTTLLREGTTVKNAVPLLVKMDELAAITTTATTDLLRANLPDSVSYIANWFHSKVPQTSPQYWMSEYGAGLGTGDSRGRIYGAGTDLIDDTTVMLTNLLRGEGDPNLKAGSGKPLAKPDEPSYQILHTVGGQKSMPMEYRWAGGRPNAPGGLWMMVYQMLTEVRNANLAHLDPTTRELILNGL